MNLSRSSKHSLDPLSDVLGSLGARVTRHTRLEAAGRWALSFSAIDRLKFVALLKGSLWMLVPGHPAHLMQRGDVCLLGRTAYSVASDKNGKPVKGEALFADGDVVRLGGEDMVAIGGLVTFSGGDARFLLEMLPTFMAVSASSPASNAVAAILNLMGDEFDRGMMGSEIVASRLAEVLLIEAIRAYAGSAQTRGIGWLTALSDARIGRALRAVHNDVAHRWTVAELAGVAGMSRAAFSSEFSRLVGRPPLAYVRAWRLSLALLALKGGRTTVGSIANDLGYASQSAFSNAFRHAFGTTPKARR